MFCHEGTKTESLFKRIKLKIARKSVKFKGEKVLKKNLAT